MNFRSFLDQDQRRVFATRTSDCLPSFETTTSATELILQVRVLPDYGLVFQGIASNTKPNLHLVQILAALHGWRLAFAPNSQYWACYFGAGILNASSVAKLQGPFPWTSIAISRPSLSWQRLLIPVR